MGWLWADRNDQRKRIGDGTETNGPTCPVARGECPVRGPEMNPRNRMPQHLSQTRQPGQKITLPTTRETSTIPKARGAGEAEANSNARWEYPSPQQMYNALLRKGYTNTPAEDVESMVSVHNFLNEGAWYEICKWEARRGNLQPRLVRFHGRPKDRTPKAAMLQTLGSFIPRYATEPPFDRHDWYISRPESGQAESSGKREGDKEVRFVIDYYEGPPEPTGEPVFFLDVRPALDSPGAVFDRVSYWAKDTWVRASGL